VSLLGFMLRVTGYEFYPNVENLVFWASGS